VKPNQDENMNKHKDTTPSAEAAEPQLLALPDANDPPASAAKLAAAQSPLLDVKAHLQVCVGGAVMTVGELTGAKVGQVVTLDRQVDGAIDLMLEGKVVARGQLVAVGDYFGIRLTELPMPLGA
jgi:flagellar motor switch protein FliN